jgi:hypothetical protein
VTLAFHQIVTSEQTHAATIGSGRGVVGLKPNPLRSQYAPSEETTLSSQPIDSSPSAAAGAAELCPSCAAPLASDQRYCLECGTRRPELSSVLAGDLRSLIAVAAVESAPGQRNGGGAAPAPPAATPPASGATAVIAGVGVLLLAMGVGVLIGRSSSNAKAATQPAQVVSVAEPGAASSTGTTTSQSPASTSTTSPSSNGSSGKHGSTKKSSSSSSEASAGGGEQTSSTTAPSAVQILKGAKGKNYEQKSKELPNKVSTG